MREFEKIIWEFCRENNIKLEISKDMPIGYETAYGTYDVTINTLFLNTDILGSVPGYESLFYLFHELRHAMQYLCTEMFDEQIRESINYIVLYDGRCFKLVEQEWQECVLDGDQDYFTCVYKNLPYEVDANVFAYEKTKEICGDVEGLSQLLDFWSPQDKMGYEELKKVFRRIDEILNQKIPRADWESKNKS